MWTNGDGCIFFQTKTTHLITKLKRRGRGRPRKSETALTKPKPKVKVKEEADEDYEVEEGEEEAPEEEEEEPKSSGRYKCEECGDLFTKPSRLQRHSKVHAVKKHKCEVCNAGFKFRFLLDRHSQSHFGKKWRADRLRGKQKKKQKMKITTVGRKLSKEERRSAHICKDCGLVFSRPSALLRHAAVHAEKTYSCEECGVGYKAKTLLTRHIVTVHEGGEEKDDDPNFGQDHDEDQDQDSGDDSGEEPSRKKRRRAGDRLRRYACPECPAKFVRTDHLRRHVIVHEEKNLFCPVCSAGFKTKQHLDRHQLTVHAEKAEDEETRTRRRLRRTMIPLSEKTYPCTQPECDGRFSRKNHLNRHLKEKHGIVPPPPLPEEPQACPVCGLILNSQPKLDKHLSDKHRPSIVVNKFECDVCGKRYRDRNNLRNHKLAHRLDKP
jgi:uncharacterized Zn-finger protein